MENLVLDGILILKMHKVFPLCVLFQILHFMEVIKQMLKLYLEDLVVEVVEIIYNNLNILVMLVLEVEDILEVMVEVVELLNLLMVILLFNIDVDKEDHHI